MIDVALVPAGLRPAAVAVVIDVLRATSTAAQALASGYRVVACADSVERARSLRAPGRTLAGERDCLPPAGFDLGNSPRDVATRRPTAELVLATTNGAPAVVAAARHAPIVLLASLLNLDAVVRSLGASRDIQLVCAGTAGEPALEDVYVAGRICARLPGARSDAARVAEHVAASFESSRLAVAAGAHAAVLMQAGLGDDVAHCARESELDVVPRVAGTTAGLAAVVDERGTVPPVIRAGATVTSPGEPARSS